MSSSLSSSLAHLRRLSSSSAAAAAAPLSISRAKSKLRSEHDPDKALDIYSSVSRHYTSPLSSRYAQDLTVSRLAKSRRFSDIETLLESHKQDPKITQEPFLSTLIRSYGRAGMFSHALHTYHQMDELRTPRSSLSFNALLSACNSSKLFDQVPHLFDEMPEKYKIVPDKVSYGNLVKAYCCMGSPELAMKTVDGMVEKGVEVTAVTLTTILDSFYKKGMVEEADRVWAEMVRKECVDTTAYNVRITHAGGSEPEIIKGLIEEMGVVGLKPDTISYNWLMTCYCRVGMMDEAKAVFKDLERNGCAPNAASFRTLIYHLCKKGRFVQGYEVFKESVGMNKIPDSETLKHLLEGLVESKRRREVSGVIRTLKKKFPAGSLRWLQKFEVETGSVESPQFEVETGSVESSEPKN